MKPVVLLGLLLVSIIEAQLTLFTCADYDYTITFTEYSTVYTTVNVTGIVSSNTTTCTLSLDVTNDDLLGRRTTTTSSSSSIPETLIDVTDNGLLISRPTTTSSSEANTTTSPETTVSPSQITTDVSSSTTSTSDGIVSTTTSSSSLSLSSTTSISSFTATSSTATTFTTASTTMTTTSTMSIFTSTTSIPPSSTSTTLSTSTTGTTGSSTQTTTDTSTTTSLAVPITTFTTTTLTMTSSTTVTTITTSTTTSEAPLCKNDSLILCNPGLSCYRSDLPPEDNQLGCAGCYERGSGCDDDQTYCVYEFSEGRACIYDLDCESFGPGTFCVMLGPGLSICGSNSPINEQQIYIANLPSTTTISTTSTSTTSSTTTTSACSYPSPAAECVQDAIFFSEGDYHQEKCNIGSVTGSSFAVASANPADCISACSNTLEVCQSITHDANDICTGYSDVAIPQGSGTLSLAVRIVDPCANEVATTTTVTTMEFTSTTTSTSNSTSISPPVFRGTTCNNPAVARLELLCANGCFCDSRAEDRSIGICNSDGAAECFENCISDADCPAGKACAAGVYYTQCPGGNTCVPIEGCNVP